MLDVKKIKLIAYDFDGVMTDNRVIIGENGTEFVVVHRGDGMAINLIKQLNILQIIISTEKNNVVFNRAQKLDIDCYYDVGNKKDVLTKFCNKNNIHLSNVLFIGNDLNDFEVMSACGFRVCPSDAAEIIKNISNLILNKPGGNGCIRELYDYIIK